MNSGLITNINDTVNTNDNLYFLGDFSWAKVDIFLDQIKCNNIFWIRGNHDPKPQKLTNPKIKWVGDYLELNYNSNRIVLFHYPICAWNMSRHGGIHLHGHSHSKVNEFKTRKMDVGVDSNNNKPISIVEILDIMLKIPTENNPA